MEINRMIAKAVRYRDAIAAVLNSLDARELEQGTLALRGSMISRDLKPFVKARSGGLLSDYKVSFENGQILIWGSLDARQLGPVEVDYKITISEFRFGATGHIIIGTFAETANPTGNMAQKLAFKAALLNGPLLKTAVKLGNIPFVHVDGSNLMVDLDEAGVGAKLPEDLNLSYLSSKDDKLTLSFR